MSSITENPNRIGNFTSSNIFKLLATGKGENGFGTPAITYIEETNIERKLGRSIETDAYSKDMAWGIFLEQRVFDMLDFEYELQSQTTDLHPSISFWAGSKDLIIKGVKIGDIKCYQPKNFAKYTDAITKANIAFLKDTFPKEYWQLVSNAIINNVPNAEAISYMPYLSELPELREAAENYDDSDQWKYRFIAESPDSSLAYLPDGGYYKNLNRFEFVIPQADKELLTSCVLKAGKMLIRNPSVLIAEHAPELSATLISGIKLTKISN